MKDIGSLMYKNLIFDVGNVIVKWSPDLIVSKTFHHRSDHDVLIKGIFRHDKWKELNRGELTEQEAKLFYADSLHLNEEEINTLFDNIKLTQTLIEGTEDLLIKLFNSGYQLYALTDNVIEIVAYLKEKYDFWQYFSGSVVSAEVGCLKPSEEIFKCILEKYQLNPKETIFIDDFAINVEASKSHGIVGIVFSNANQCRMDLVNYGIKI